MPVLRWKKSDIVVWFWHSDECHPCIAWLWMHVISCGLVALFKVLHEYVVVDCICCLRVWHTDTHCLAATCTSKSSSPPSPVAVAGISSTVMTAPWGGGGTAVAAPPPFTPGKPALCGSHPLVTPYYCRLGDLLCYIFVSFYRVLFRVSMCIMFCALFVFFSFVDFPSVLLYCWLGLLTCKNHPPYNLYCVGGNVKHYSINRVIWAH